MIWDVNPAAEVVVNLLEPRRVERQLARESQGREQIEPGTERRTALGAHQARLLFARA